MTSKIQYIINKCSRLRNVALANNKDESLTHYGWGVVPVKTFEPLSALVVEWSKPGRDIDECLPSLIAETDRIVILATGGFND